MIPSRLSATSTFGRIARRLWTERRWLLALVALFVFVRLPNIDGWDEAFYTGQLVSAVADRDLRLQDDVVAIPRRFEEKHRILTTTLPSGALLNTMSIGPAIVLSPVAAPLLARSHPPPWTAFRTGAAVTAMLLLLLTCAITLDLVRRLGVPDGHSLLAAGLVTIAGPLAVYGTRSYLHSHLTAAFLVALTLHQAIVLTQSRRWTSALGLGLAVGLACVNRWQDVVVVGPIVLVALWPSGRRSAEPRPTARALRGSAWPVPAGFCALGFVLAAACQLLAWQRQFGSALLVPQGAGYMHWLHPRVVPLLFSTYNGLLPWAPGLGLGLLGLGLALRGASGRLRWLLVALVASTLLAVYVSACPEDWWGRDSFGPRRLASLTPIGAVGLAFVLRRLEAKTRVALGVALSIAGVCLASAHFSGHRDLWLLLFGTPDPLSPDPGPGRPATPWMDRWGPLHFAKPGFTLSDTPGWTDRLVGLAVVACVVFAARLLWRALHRYRAAQAGAVVLAAAFVFAWAVALFEMPSDTATNAAWKTFLEAPLDPARAASLPPDTAQARDVVIAVAAAAEGDGNALAAAMTRLQASGIAVTEADVARAVAAREPR
jgi:hypothetical protein